MSRGQLNLKLDKVLIDFLMEEKRRYHTTMTGLLRMWILEKKNEREKAQKGEGSK